MVDTVVNMEGAAALIRALPSSYALIGLAAIVLYCLYQVSFGFPGVFSPANFYPTDRQRW